MLGFKQKKFDIEGTWSMWKSPFDVCMVCIFYIGNGNSNNKSIIALLKTLFTTLGYVNTYMFPCVMLS